MVNRETPAAPAAPEKVANVEREPALESVLGAHSLMIPTHNPARKEGKVTTKKPSGRPSAVQKRYLERGLSQPGGKLPLFDDKGQEIDARTIRACVEKGWAEPWFTNALKPDWLVCKLTDAGRALFAGTD